MIIFKYKNIFEALLKIFILSKKQTLIFHESLHIYIQMETADNLFNCPQCPKTYKTKSGLTRHIKNKHTEKLQNKLTANELEMQISKASK